MPVGVPAGAASASRGPDPGPASRPETGLPDDIAGRTSSSR